MYMCFSSPCFYSCVMTYCVANEKDLRYFTYCTLVTGIRSNVTTHFYLQHRFRKI